MTPSDHSVPRAGTLNQISYCRRCGAAFDKKGPCTMSTDRLVASALAVMLLDPKIRAFLEANDPKALEISSIYSVASVIRNGQGRPFRAPHCSCSDLGLVGRGRTNR